jgi:G:T-mismatch repair DNA endonuclease (very short patch repair protein)
LGIQPESGGNTPDTCRSAGKRSERQLSYPANSCSRPMAVIQALNKRTFNVLVLWQCNNFKSILAISL